MRAQVHAITGELDIALALIDEAAAGFAAAGAASEALRTQLGRMHVLNERGSHDDAVRTGEAVLADLDADGAVPDAGAGWLRAKVHHNLAICHTFAGRHGPAEQHGRLAEEAYRAAGLDSEIASLHQNRAEGLLELGHARESLPLFHEAAAEFHASGLMLFEARCLVGIGRASALLGRWKDSLGSFDQAREQLERLDVGADLDQLLVRTAEAWLAVGLHDEALTAYHQAEPSLRASGQVHYLAQLLAGTGSALASAGRLVEARENLAEAAELHEASGHAGLLAQARLEIADVLDRRGLRADARIVAQEALDGLGDGGWDVQRVYAHLRAADLALPDLGAARQHLVTAAALTQQLALPPLTYRVDARRGRVERLAGNTDQARRLLNAATIVVEELRASLPTETLRTSFLRDAATAYVELVALELDAGDLPAAFAAAERSKSRTLLDLLSGGASARRKATRRPPSPPARGSRSSRRSCAPSTARCSGEAAAASRQPTVALAALPCVSAPWRWSRPCGPNRFARPPARRTPLVIRSHFSSSRSGYLPTWPCSRTTCWTTRSSPSRSTDASCEWCGKLPAWRLSLPCCGGLALSGSASASAPRSPAATATGCSRAPARS